MPTPIDAKEADKALNFSAMQQGVFRPGAPPKPLRVEDKGGMDPSRTYKFTLGSDLRIYGLGDTLPDGPSFPVAIKLQTMQGMPYATITVYRPDLAYGDPATGTMLRMDKATSVSDNYWLTGEQATGDARLRNEEWRLNQFVPQNYLDAFRGSIVDAQNKGLLFRFTVSPSEEAAAGSPVQHAGMRARGVIGVAAAAAITGGAIAGVLGYVTGEQGTAPPTAAIRSELIAAEKIQAPGQSDFSVTGHAQFTFLAMSGNQCPGPYSGPRSSAGDYSYTAQGNRFSIKPLAPGLPVEGTINGSAFEASNGFETYQGEIRDGTSWKLKYLQSLPGRDCRATFEVVVDLASPLSRQPILIDGPPLAGLIAPGLQFVPGGQTGGPTFPWLLVVVAGLGVAGVGGALLKFCLPVSPTIPQVVTVPDDFIQAYIEDLRTTRVTSAVPSGDDQDDAQSGTTQADGGAPAGAIHLAPRWPVSVAGPVSTPPIPGSVGTPAGPGGTPAGTGSGEPGSSGANGPGTGKSRSSASRSGL